MVVYKEYTNDQYAAFFKNAFNGNYNYTEDRMADWFMGQAGAQSVIGSYGVTKSNLLSTYIPILKEKLNGGYFMFLATCVNEGGGAGNWINHYMSDTSSDPRQCMRDDCDYINSILYNKSTHATLYANEVNGGAPVPEDNPGEADRVLASCEGGTIGRYYMPATMAGNAWVYATTWCTNHQGAAPGAYFNNPYDQIIDLIKSAGVDPFSGSGGGGGGSDQPSGNQLITDPVELVKRLLKAMLVDMHFINNNNMYMNLLVKITKQLDNTYKLSPNFDINKLTLAAINALFGNNQDDNNGNGGEGKAGYYWPFNGNNKIILTSPYGYRDASIGSGAFHQGIDIVDSGGSGTPIYAIHNGTVTVSSDSVPGWESAGSMILIKNDTDNKIVTYEEFHPGSMMVNVGDTVKGGQQIAINGVSGNATGEHLHLGINEKGFAPLNPSNWEDPSGYIGINNQEGTYSRPDQIGNSGN